MLRNFLTKGAAVASTPARNITSMSSRPAMAARWAPAMGGSSLGSFVAPSTVATPKRFLDLHEYQSKGLMADFNVRVQRGKVANSAAEAREVADWLKETGAAELVLKAQIHAGGRGKGHFNTGYKGGVKITESAADVEEAASNMLGNYLITKQTGPEGQLTNKVLVHEGINFNKEFYFAILMDRAYGGPVVVYSPQGGMDIEEVAESNPEAIFTEPVDIELGIQDHQTEKIARRLGFEGAVLADAQEQMKNLYKLFIGLDSTQVEINPFVVTNDGLVYCVDAKIGFDDNAQFRQKEAFSMRDTSMEDERDVKASEFGLNYIGLDGNIGCMVNGAGLAMATMDIIKLHGGDPANFLDVGGGANEKQVEEAFKILTGDPQVKAILVNIFGGIMKCDIIAQGVVNAARTVGLKIPLVVRLAGTNVELGKEIINNSGLNVIAADDLDDAAIKAVATLQ